MTRKAEREKLRATAEELLGYSKPLDLFERETIKEIRMDRAERIARERGKKKGWTEVEIQDRATLRRRAKDVGLWILRAIGLTVAGRAVKEVDKRL